MFSPLQNHRQPNPYGQQFDRAQQVNELLVAQPLCRATNRDRSLLEVGMRLTDGTLTSMRISLPTGFPTDRPALSITSPVRHPWVDSIGRLSFPLLDRWGAPAVRLAAVVADALKGLGGTPAPLPSRAQAPGSGAAASPTRPQQYGQQGAAHPAPSPQGSSGQLSAAGSGLAGAGSHPAAGPKVQPPPPIPSSFPEVEDMSEEQLATVLADAAAYKRLVDAVAERIGLFKETDALVASNRELAAANLALAEEQADKRNQVAIIRSSEYAPAKAAFDDKYARQATVLEKLAPEVLLRRLQDGVKEAEEAGQRLLRQLQGGELGVEAFMEQYIKAQAQYHRRDLKLQAAQQTLPQLQTRG